LCVLDFVLQKHNLLTLSVPNVFVRVWGSCASVLSCVQLFFFQQTLGTITAVPIKVPQVSSLQRLAGQGPAVLPQVQNTVPEGIFVSFCMYSTLFLSGAQAWVGQHTHFAE